MTQIPLQIAAVGLGATAFADAFALCAKRLFGLPSPDYGLLGRWVGHMPQGRLAHPAITEATPVAHERVLGWATHYATGVAFAALLVAIDPAWLARPTPGPALLFGLFSLAAPFLILQPAFGLGVAAAR